MHMHIVVDMDQSRLLKVASRKSNVPGNERALLIQAAMSKDRVDYKENAALGTLLSTQISAFRARFRSMTLLPTVDNTFEGIAKRDGTKEIWIFGFGSLVWKADFEYSRRVEGFIRNYQRVFYQGSTDHRGTPFAPGRTVTLIEVPGSSVWGAAYLLKGDINQQRETLRYLEWREKQYDLREHVPVYSRNSDTEPVISSALVYIATSDKSVNRNWLGPASKEEIAQQIATARGPSGPNTEYLFRLAEAVRQVDAHDEELEWLDARVKEIIRDATRRNESLDKQID